MKLVARDLIQYTEEQMWNLPPNTAVELHFEDGVLNTTVERTILSYYYWEVHKHFPKLPMLVHHHVGNEYFNNNIHGDIFKRISEDLYTYMEYNEYIECREQIWAVLFEVNNNIYNKMISNLDKDVVSTSFVDFVELLEHDKIKEVNDTVKPTQRSIDKSNSKIKKILMSDKSIAGNSQVILTRSESLKLKQQLQLLGPRGFVTDVNSRILPIPITSSFTSGMSDLYESMAESRSASKALLLAKDPLSACEYFNRKLQLVSQVIDTLDLNDCGSNITYPWLVEANELSLLDGMNHMVDGKVLTIRKGNKDIVGKTLNLRLPFGCLHPDPQTICVTCFGITGLSLPDGTNPGHMSAIDIGEKTSQLVLSTKHHEGSSAVDDIIIPEEYQGYLTPGSDGVTIRFSDELTGKKVSVILDVVRGGMLASLKHIDHIEDTSFISTMSDITLEVTEGETVERFKVPCSMGARKGSFTKMFLLYVKHIGVQLNDKGEYVIDISEWLKDKVDNSVFTLPLKHTNMIDFKDEIESYILTSNKKYGLKHHRIFNKEHKGECCDVIQALKGLNNLVSSKINVNLSHLSTIALAMSVKDPLAGDYNVCKAGVPVKFSTISEIMGGRSLSVAMAYEGQDKYLVNHNSYINKDRPRHPMDLILLK